MYACKSDQNYLEGLGLLEIQNKQKKENLNELVHVNNKIKLQLTHTLRFRQNPIFTCENRVPPKTHVKIEFRLKHKWK